MPIRRIDLPQFQTAAFPYTHLVLDGEYAFLSGVVASDVPGGAAAHGDVGEETRIVMTAIRDALASIGLAMDRIVRVDVHMTDLDQMPALNQVYRGFFAEGLPSRTCTESRKLAGGSNVEITVMARLES
jgi:2-iminobutanoate/2-iminopropanoate deaminase